MSTTATKEGTETKTWTLREVEKQAATLEELRKKLVELREKEVTLQADVAEAIAAGEDPSELQADLRSTSESRELHEGAEPVLEERIRERRFLAHQALARERLQTIKKKAGGLVGEYGRKVERLEEAREKFLDLARDVKATPEHLGALKLEARIIAARFDLPEPDLRTLTKDEGKRASRAAGMARPPNVGHESMWLGISSRLRKGDYVGAARSLARIVAQLFGAETPVVELVESLEERPAA